MSYYSYPAYTWQYPAYYGYSQNWPSAEVYGQEDGNYPGPPSGPAAWFNFSNGIYLKGFLVGAAVTLVVANPAVQKTIVKGAVRLWSGIQGGFEEVKEHVQDVKAEMSGK